MDPRPSALSDTVLPPPLRPPLITPSLSPPGSRVYQRAPDKPAPAKRPRLSSTPSSSVSTRLASSQPPDFRLDSSSRLFAFWDQLADRYNRPLEEDDIIDLSQLKLLRDRGVTRSATQSYEIGGLAIAALDDADDDASCAVEDESEAGTGGEDTAGDEDSADELDLLSPPAVKPVVQEKLEYYKNWNVPPVDEQDPVDAEDFREFEEAERRRIELYGEEKSDDEEDADIPVATGSPSDGDAPDSYALDEYGIDCATEFIGDEADGDEVRTSPSPTRPTPRRRKSKPPPPPLDDESEDELATWMIDDTPIPPRRSVPPNDDIIDLTLPPSPCTAPSRGRARSRPPIQKRGASRARSQSQARASSKSKSRIEAHPATSPRSPSLSHPLQLFTPPRSSCSAPDTAPKANDHLTRDETPSPKMPRPRPRFVPKPRIEETIPTTLEPIVASPRTRSPSPVMKVVKKASRPGMKPEVLITARRTGSTKAKKLAAPETPSHLRHTDGKGKGSTAPSLKQGRPPAPSALQRERSKSRAGSRDTSPPPIPPRGRKRRRVSSTPSLDSALERRSSSQPSPQKQPSSGRSSGYSSDAGPSTSSPVRTDYLDESASARSDRIRHRSISEAPLPPLPIYYPIHPQLPPGSIHNASNSGPFDSHPLGPIHLPHPTHPMYQPEAMAWASYFVATGALIPPSAHPPGSGYHPGLPLPFYGLPQTPSHRAHAPYPNFHTPSSSASGPSWSATHSSPTRYQPMYPHWVNPAYSSGTLPPSSPIPSSPITSSPILRPASVPPGQRSQARGRRVSFKLDANDRPLSHTPPRHALDSDPVGSDLESAEDRPLSRGRSWRSSTPANPARDKGKGKGKARAVSPDDEDLENGAAEEADYHRGQSPPRARTPGPPSRRAQSLPRDSTGSVSGSSAGKGQTRSAKKK
ncbi:hypothetical protein C2E23DRAFT_817478 [Lenzites betulinus]|nr:hypothetical protein C2E23DRAFT_817478 [Lenzites betulinus]